MGNFSALKNDIASVIKKSKIEEDTEHSKRTLRWLLKIKPNSSKSLQIAALAHDIDRAVEPRATRKTSESYDSYKQRHAKRSALITTQLMKNHGYDAKTIQHVKNLIENHEIGGGKETDVLTDADSITYFDYNILFYFKRKGPDATKDKIKFMYSRASPRAKKLIKEIKFSKQVKELFKNVITV